ncbi:MAG: homoserine dehydrogenase [Desulfarculus sp.]|nr:homoserine dehydrogenase [Desulfarculus sp.]
MADRIIKVGLLGLGTVGGGVARLLLEQRDLLTQRLGARLELARAVDLDAKLAAELDLPAGVFSTDAGAVLDDPAIDIVVELIGGLKPAKDFALRAIGNGKHVATANKALLANHGAEIFAAARHKRVGVAFEASVAGGIPLIKALREGLAANRVTRVLGILNGTCNYILSRMTSEGAEFGAVLKDAQKLGYAEADPTFDVEGIDTAHKLAIVAALVSGQHPRLSDIPTQGISQLTPLDIQLAREFGYRIKLLALCRQQDGLCEARVHPALVPQSHLMASVEGPFNAVHLTGDWVDEVMLYGRGAGRRPTASAVAADLMDLARDILCGCGGRVPGLGVAGDGGQPLELAPLERVSCQYYFRFTAQDQPGVLAAISRVLGEHRISIEAVIQKGRQDQGAVPIVMLTHEAREADVQKALAVIDHLPVIAEPTMLIRKA